jgi:hypothetical protein
MLAARRLMMINPAVGRSLNFHSQRDSSPDPQQGHNMCFLKPSRLSTPWVTWWMDNHQLYLLHHQSVFLANHQEWYKRRKLLRAAVDQVMHTTDNVGWHGSHISCKQTLQAHGTVETGHLLDRRWSSSRCWGTSRSTSVDQMKLNEFKMENQ